MKPEEIKKAIRGLKNIVEYWCNRPEEIETAKLAIAALEKQIPKKPERLNSFRSIGKCGGCERVISTRTASVYCQYCGNKVDWGNEE